ncbi:MAG: hypothetical protein GY869_17875, partial [Planctomycetes bacterium]|nr:hypothetical protein [Planctomycetota bacterium]
MGQDNSDRPGTGSFNQQQQRRVLELVYVLRYHLVTSRTEQWVGAIRELVEIGKPAVGELVAELERTNREAAKRVIGLTLRAIGDPRAVPALIRAILNTPLHSGDFGDRIFDRDLHEFMMDHQVGRREEYPKYGYGRSVQEIYAALDKITGHSVGKENEKKMLRGDDKAIQRDRERLAKRWQKWWDKHWREFVTAEELATVEEI